MKFPSIKNLAESAYKTIERFPAEVLFALAGTVAATIKIELNYLNRVDENWSLRAMMVANLGLLLSLSATLFAESKGITGRPKLFLRLGAAVAALLLILIINPGERDADYIRFFLFSLAFHLSVAFAAFSGKGHIQGFWQFNKTLFIRILTSALYSAVLFLGLAAAIGAMNFLFNFKFEWDTFAILWAWIVGMFSTLFFLSGVPNEVKALDADLSYPQGLKVFTQYVLIPLATVYVIILIAYEAKILVQWELPKGLVSNLILGYAVFGILSLLLVFPIREQQENKWLKNYARSFYFLLIPLLLLLFTAAGTRIFRYGITEMRYFLILLACWLFFITVYFLTAKKQNIKIIPISLSIVTLLSIYGPQSAFSVAMYSQRRILIKIFERNNAFKNGRLYTVDSLKIKPEEGRKAYEALKYLVTKHDLASLQPYLDEDLNRVGDSLAMLKTNRGGVVVKLSNWDVRYNKVNWAEKRLGLRKFSDDSYDADTAAILEKKVKFYRFTVSNIKTIKVAGYDYVISEDRNFADTTSYNIDGVPIKQITDETGIYSLALNNSSVYFNLQKLMGQLAGTNKGALKNAEQVTLPDSTLTLTKETGGYQIIFKINQINFRKDGGKFYLDYLDANYLIKNKRY